MLHAIPGMLLVTVTFVVVAAALLGLGLGLRRVFGVRGLDPDEALLAPWVGFALVVLFLLLWNFVFPVNDWAFGLVLLAGALGLAANRAELRALVAAHRSGWTAWPLGLLALAVLWLADLALGPMSNWDTGLYHMQGVRWAAEHPAVPGLANLFGPLAFNNASLLYGALLDVGPWTGRAWHVTNGTLVFLWVVTVFVAGRRLASRRHRPTAADLFTFLTLAPVVSLVASDTYASYEPDAALRLTRLALVTLWFRMLLLPRSGLAGAFELVALLLLAAVGVAIKMNAVIFASLAVVTAGVLWLRRPLGVPGAESRAITWSLALGVTFGLAWAGRGVVLSGYPVFPSQALAAPVEWRAPAEHAKAEFDYVVHSTRVSTGNLDFVAGRTKGFGAWVPRWLSRLPWTPYELLVPIGLALLFLPLLRLKRVPGPGGPRPEAWWMLLPAVVALVGWFLVAPAPRYVAGIFWLFPLLIAAQAYGRLQLATEPRWNRRLVVAGLLLGLSPAVVQPLLDWQQDGRDGNPLRAVARENVVLLPQGMLMRGPAGRPYTWTYVSVHGVRLIVPRGRCWDAPVPCTPNPAPNLRLRVEGKPTSGYVVDGQWAMEDWPERWKAKYRQAWAESRRRANP
jgi:hypothetical protein